MDRKASSGAQYRGTAEADVVSVAGDAEVGHDHASDRTFDAVGFSVLFEFDLAGANLAPCTRRLSSPLNGVFSADTA